MHLLPSAASCTLLLLLLVQEYAEAFSSRSRSIARLPQSLLLRSRSMRNEKISLSQKLWRSSRTASITRNTAAAYGRKKSKSSTSALSGSSVSLPTENSTSDFTPLTLVDSLPLDSLTDASINNILENSNEDDTLLETASSSSTGTSLSTTETPTPKLSDASSSEAAAVVVEDNKTPSYRELSIFTATTIVIWLSEPLLSLVDTTIVGLYSGRQSVLQLASLGPATTLMDSLIYLTYFLAIATTSLISRGRATRDYRGLQQTTSHVLGLGALIGAASTLLVTTVGRPLLTSMAGASASPALVSFAYRYSLIRASVGIASVVGMVAQSFCLATLDTKTPALAVLAASAINLSGDILLAKHGVVGAAIATAGATLASTTILLRSVRRQMKQWRQLEVAEEQQQNQQHKQRLKEPDETIERQTTIEMRTPSVTLDETTIIATATSDDAEVGEVANREKSADNTPIPLLSLPNSRQALTEFFRLSGPIFFVILAKVICYGAMTLRITDFGVLSLAAHNIMMRIFFFFACFGDAVSQTAQSYMPSALYSAKNGTKHMNGGSNARAFRKLLVKLFVVAAVLGVVNSTAAVCILQSDTLGHILSNNAHIVDLMKTHAPYMGLALSMHPFIMLLEGTVIAARSFTTLMATYVVTLGLHFGILKYFGGNFAAVWRTLGLFQGVRLINFTLRVWRQQHTNENSAEEKASSSVS